MALSKSSEIIFDLIVSYTNQLYSNPLKTKAITSCAMALLGNYISQKIIYTRQLDVDSFAAFGLFGFFFGGPIPHFFYKYIYRFTKNPLAVLFIERLFYTPLFQALSLYMIARFEFPDPVNLLDRETAWREVLGKNYPEIVVNEKTSLISDDN